jgi:hypothetical protein
VLPAKAVKALDSAICMPKLANILTVELAKMVAVPRTELLKYLTGISAEVGNILDSATA